MKKQKEFQKNVSDETKKMGLLDKKEMGLTSRKYNHLKKYLYIGGLAGIGLFLNGCFPGYVSSQPTYTEVSRPTSPSSVHVWVDGNWTYNRNNRAYEHRDGYWAKPSHGRKFVAGHWTSTPRGHRWVKGHWTSN